MVLLVLMSILGIATLVYCLTKKDFPLCLFATVAGIIDVLYIAALFGQLWIPAKLLFFGGLAACLASAALLASRPANRPLLRGLASPGPMLFIVAVIAFRACSSDMTYYAWDDFMNWGLAAKEMLFTNGLPTSGTALPYQDYSRGTTVFYYFFTLNSHYDEGVTFFAFFVFLAAPLAVLFSRWGWRQIHWAGLALLFAMLVNSIAGVPYGTLYVDVPLAVYVGVTLTAYFWSEGRLATLAFLVPVLFALPLIKKVGFHFGLLCVVVMCADALLRLVFSGGPDEPSKMGLARTAWRRLVRAAGSIRRFFVSHKTAMALPVGAAILIPLAIWLDAILAGQLAVILCAITFLLSPSRWFAHARWLGKWERLRHVVVGVLVAAAPIAAHYSWQHWVTAHRLQPSFALAPRQSHLDVLDAFKDSAGPQEKQTRDAFVDALKNTALGTSENPVYANLRERWAPTSAPVVPRLSAREYAVLLAVFLALAAALAPDGLRRLRVISCAVLVFCGMAAYLLSLLANYLMTFGDYNASHLLEFRRYVWAYLMIVVVLTWGLLAWFGGVDGVSRTRRRLLFAGLLTFSAYLYLFENASYAVVRSPFGFTRVQARDELRPRVDFVRSNTQPLDNVFVICQDSTGYELQFMAYDLFPRHTNWDFWSLGRPYYTNDPATRDIALERWAKLLRSYGYVFVARGDEKFWTTYASVFDEQRREGEYLFRVRVNDEDEVTLTPVR